jgi:hypothetical protein
MMSLVRNYQGTISVHMNLLNNSYESEIVSSASNGTNIGARQIPVMVP